MPQIPDNRRRLIFRKSTLKFKLKCVKEYKKNGSIDFADTREQRKHLTIHVREWAVRFDQYGVDGLRHHQANKRWTPPAVCREASINAL